MDGLGITIIFVLTVLIAYPLGKYISKIYEGEKTWLDFLSPLENFIFRICSIDKSKEYDWKENLKIFLMINSIWFIYAIILLCTQGSIPLLNPDGISSMGPYQAFNTAVSFVTNTNLQHYSGETNLTYFSQIFVIGFLQFVSAAAGMAALAILLKALKSSSTRKIGNFYVFFVKSGTRILLPIAIIVGTILILNSVPMTFHGNEKVSTLEGDSIHVAKGPAAAVVAIKQIGTNGGGYFGANSAHPFENPNMITNIVEVICIALLPVAMIFTFGYYLNRKKMAWIIFAVMTVGFLLLLAPIVHYEAEGNPAITKLGIVQTDGSPEGREIRFGSAMSAYWGAITTNTSNGSVNAMHDSMSPLSGAFLMLGMQINAFYGGVGVGLNSMFLFIIIAVFISGLMIGRTPELFGKKIEAKEIKIAVIVTLLHPLLILGGTALSSYIMVTAGGNDSLKWLNNPGFHGFSEMLYEFTSAAANNGSGFEGLGDNTLFWNISTGVVMLLGRFIPIIGTLAIGGSMAGKKNIPPSQGTLKVDSFMFGVMLFFVIVIIGALLFIPAIVMGPIAEYFTL